MKVSELWLRALINTDLSVTALADKLTDAGIEVDSLEMSSTHAQQGILTLKVPPNRGDCLSMEGVARELSLLLEKPLIPVDVKNSTVVFQKSAVNIEEPELCPRYLGCIVKNLNNQSVTPQWIKERLELAGLRSLSFIVDITNYVMLELGQPLHAFDLAKCKGNIHIRKSKANETLKLLDGETTSLVPDTLIIADENGPMAIAGVMGGLNTAVDESSTAIFLECAYFNPIAIRKGAKDHNLRTDASFRFERGVDPNLQARALLRAVALLQEAGGEVENIFEENFDKCLPKNPIVNLRSERIKKVLGLDLDRKIVFNLLKRAYMDVKERGNDFQVTPPSFRQDIAIEVDLIEEIARIYGFQNIKSEKFTSSICSFPIPETEVRDRQFKEVLIARGYTEAVTYSFVDKKSNALIEPLKQSLSLANPISSDMGTMRTSLWPGLLQAIQHNQSRQMLRTRFFEVGTSFIEEQGKICEIPMLAGACSGDLYPEQWAAKTTVLDIFDIKADVEALLHLFKGQHFTFETMEHPALHPGQSAKIVSTKDGQSWQVGTIGKLHPKLIKDLELEQPIVVFELYLSKLGKGHKPEFRPLSKFPAIRRDLALLIDKTVSYEEIQDAIKLTAGEWLQEIILFDIYEGQGIPLGKKSIAVGLILQHPSRTLIEGEINDIVSKIIAMLSQSLGAIQRE